MEAAAHVPVPVVQTFHALGTVKRRHNGSADGSPTQRVAEERRLAMRADHIVATCSDERRELQHLGAGLDRISVVPCGVDRMQFSPRGPVAPRGARPRLVAVSRLVRRKGLDDVVAALPAIEDAELLIAGGPPADQLAESSEAQRLRDTARRAGVANRVKLLGGVPQQEVPALLRSADVAVLVPWYEPFGIVPVEAMACGVPFIGSAVGGLLDTVRHGVTGYLVPPHEPLALARAARRLLDDDALRRRMGRAGAEHARAYDWRSVAEATLDVYARVVQTSSQPLSGVAT